MGENIGQRSTRIIAIKRYQFKKKYIRQTCCTSTRSYAQIKKIGNQTSTKLKIVEDQKFQTVVTNTARIIRLGQKHHYYQELCTVLQTVNLIK